MTFGFTGRYKTRADFSSDKMYAYYIHTTARPGMTVRTVVNDPRGVIKAGDEGVVTAVTEGRPSITVQWDKHGRMMIYNAYVELV